MNQSATTSQNFNTRLTTTQSSFMNFFNIADSGDINSAYRGRQIWTKYQQEDLVHPAEALLTEVPAARNAVLHFISNLCHENVHHFFTEKERKDAAVKTAADHGNLASAIHSLIAKLDALRIGLGPKSSFSMLILNWLFELFSDLCRQNHNRPYFNHQRPAPAIILKAFQQIPCISILLTLLEATFTSILNIAPDKAIHAFITFNKIYGNNLDWVTIYITDSFPSNIVDQLIKTGADEFQAFCIELSKSKRAAQMQDEYSATKLRLYSDIFQYMDRNRKAELRSCFFSIILRFIQTCDNVAQTVFLIKLALFTPEIVLPFTDELIQLVIDPRFVDHLKVLNQNASFKIAVSYPPNQLQGFFSKILERAATNSLFSLLEFIGPLTSTHS